MIAYRWENCQNISQGLTPFGVNNTEFSPNAYSAKHHWYENEVQFIHVLSGDVSLNDNSGESILRAGDKAVLKVGHPNGLHLDNRPNAAARHIEIGASAPKDIVHYKGIDRDTVKINGKKTVTHKDGSTYEENSK